MSALEEHFRLLDYDSMDELRLYVRRGGVWEEIGRYSEDPKPRYLPSWEVKLDRRHPPELRIGDARILDPWRLDRGYEPLVIGNLA